MRYPDNEMKIYSLEPLSASQQSLIYDRLGCTVVILPRDVDLFCKSVECQNVEVLICRDRDDIDSVLNYCPRLKFLYVVSVGVEKLPFGKLMGRGVVVCNAKGVNAEIMAQYAMAYILADATRLHENSRNQVMHRWKKFQCVDPLKGKKLLIVGAGTVGQLIFKRAVVFGVDCVGVKRRSACFDDRMGIISLDAVSGVIGSSDYIVNLLPLTPDTRKFFNLSIFRQMKKSAVFINISRAGVVDTDDLVISLSEGIIASAVLDVFDSEPLDADSDLWNVPNLIITPHSSGRLENYIDASMKCFCDNYEAYLQRGTCPNKVDLDAGY